MISGPKLFPTPRLEGPRPGIGTVIVHHLDPTHESLLTDLLAPSTQMPVLAADHWSYLVRDGSNGATLSPGVPDTVQLIVEVAGLCASAPAFDVIRPAGIAT